MLNRLTLVVVVGLVSASSMCLATESETQQNQNVMKFYQSAQQQSTDGAVTLQPVTNASTPEQKPIEQPVAAQLSSSSSVPEQNAIVKPVESPVVPQRSSDESSKGQSATQSTQTNSSDNPPLIKNQIAAYSVYALVLGMLAAAAFMRWKYVNKRRNELAEHENLEVLFSTNYAPLNRVIGLLLLALMPFYVMFYPWDNLWGQLAIASMVAFAGIFLLTCPNDLISFSHKTNSYLISKAVPNASATPKASVSDSVPESWRIFFGLVNFIVKFANAIRLSLLNFDKEVYRVVPIDSLTGTSSYMQSEYFMREGNLKHKTEFWVDVFSKHGNWRFSSRSSGKVDSLGFRLAQLSHLS